MLSIVLTILFLLSFVVAGLLYYFGDYRKLPWYTVVVCFLAWLFPFSLPLILPLDLASTDYREKCLTEHNGTVVIICDKPLAYVEDDFLLTYWKAVYWTMFCLTWFTIPMTQAWVRAGDFRLGRRLWAALKDNLIYWSMLGGVGLVFLIYILFVMQITKDTLLTMGMAAGNAWGLLLVTIMMGYGLVEVPRTLWYDANTAWSLSYMEFVIPGAKEAMVDAEAEIYDIARQIAIASKKMPRDSPHRPLVDKLIRKCPIALEERSLDRNIDQDEIPKKLDEEYLTELHAAIKRAVKVNDRTQAQYRFVLEKAYLYQDIIENYRNRDKKFVSPLVQVKNDRFADHKLKAYWYWYVWIRPGLLRTISVVAMLWSLGVVWSESTFQIEGVTLSVPAAIVQSPYVGYAATELVAVGFILYMCTCAYSTLFKIKFMDYYLVPEHHTDEGSLMFIGSYLCKLTFPLCYNFLNMVEDEKSVFIQYQGKAVSLTPLLGDGYNKWLPEIVLVFAAITLLNLHGRILRLCRIQHFSYYDATTGPATANINEGRQIIEQARAMEERKRTGGGGASDSRYGHDLGGGSSNARAGGSRGPRATNAKDFLAKYKNAKTDTFVGEDINAPVSAAAPPPNAGATAAGSRWTINPLKDKLAGVFGGAKTVPAGGGGPKFQRLEDDVEAGQSAEFVGAGNSDSAGAGGTGRKFGVGAAAQAKEKRPQNMFEDI
ncbi:LMBR1-like membrane protein-domain-containing protein [Geranomyces variabilis]|nr:LMBR1-like membrane protein-domain-containing protein [Geranomyces variabilis]KAJ3138403.1 hypothetical protein HDU90_001367 [Geranomyces variabilis]